MSIFDKDITSPQTIAQMVSNYEVVISEINKAFDSIDAANVLMESTFGEYAKVNLSRNGYADREYALEEAQRTAWNRVISKLGVHKVLPEARKAKLDAQIESGDIGPLTTAAVFDLLQLMQTNGTDLRDEVIKEAYDAIRPNRHDSHYKSNSAYTIEGRVVLNFAIERNYRSGFRPRAIYMRHRTDPIRAIDKAFHLLDGKGMPEGYNTPLCDALSQVDRGEKGQTEYFEFKCFDNGNLHLWFRRKDLLHKFNEVAGRTFLKPSEEFATR